jgi:starch-binding outer membrane protein, SusD/RagB family
MQPIKFLYKYCALLLLFFMALMPHYSCKKWLDVKRAKAAVVPETLKDFQAFLDNRSIMNSLYPSLGIIGTDDYYITSLQVVVTFWERNTYTWARDIYETATTVTDWTYPYIMVEYANIALDGLKKIDINPGNQAEWNNEKGSALFYRAQAFYNLAQLFAKPYTANTAATDLGIPLRLNSDINEISIRGTVEQTYNQVVNDLKEAEALLPLTPRYKTRPSKTAAQGLLARVYLSRGDYVKAGEYATATLNLYGTLIDFNSTNTSIINPAAAFSFPTFPNNHPEVIYYATAISPTIINPAFGGLVDTLLYQSYDSNDRRKAVFFTVNATNGTASFKGNYTGTYAPFAGISTNEIYLIQAECNARQGNTAAAMGSLNTLLQKRMKPPFVPLTAIDATEALNKILVERRKELLLRDTRWADLRRLNEEPAYQKTLYRILNGQTYSLPPKDNRYVLPIPYDEIRLSGIQQNNR